MARIEVYCARCGSWHEDEVSEEDITTMSVDGNSITHLCPVCERVVNIEFDTKYPHAGCCGSKDGR